MVLAALFACKPVSPGVGPIPFDYLLDGDLRMHEAQAIGTHNSYHVSNHNGIDQQDYTHTPLAWQLGHEGVRHFELDVWWDEETGQFLVYHIPVLDPETVCETFVRCLADIKGWSDFNPGHFPLVVIVETKDEKDEDVPARLDALDAEILSVWPEERLVTPAMVQGDHPDLATALADEGWPVLGEVRGRLMLGLHTRGTMRTVYTDGLTVADRVMFPEVFDGEPDRPFAALEGIDDPYQDDAIAASLAKNRIVRTRADADTEEARAGDTTRRDHALEGGAQLVSTDYPVPVEGIDYVATMPGGTPIRCDPLTASDACTPEALEDPRFIDANGAAP